MGNIGTWAYGVLRFDMHLQWCHMSVKRCRFTSQSAMLSPICMAPNMIKVSDHYNDVINDVIMGTMASHNFLLNRSFGRRSKKASKLRVTGLCVGNSPRPVNSPHKWLVTRKMFPFDDVIMITHCCDVIVGVLVVINMVPAAYPRCYH